MLVNFIICGAQRSGTSALFSYLKEHKDIYIASQKEVHFFDKDWLFLGRKPNYLKYHDSFNLSESNKVIGEATPIYMYWDDCPRRMWEYNPNLKLIVLLRNPITRAYSHWRMEKLRNAEDLSFWDAIQKEPLRSKEKLPRQDRVFSYIDRGFYLSQLRRLWRYFSKENVLVLQNEDLRYNPIECLHDVCNFLQIDYFETVEPKQTNINPYLSEMGNQAKEYLQNVFEYEIKGLERVLDWDCSDWLL